MSGLGESPTKNSRLPPTEAEASETMEVLYELSNLLNTGLDRKSLSILVGLCEAGVNPEALSAVVKELDRVASEEKNKRSDA